MKQKAVPKIHTCQRAVPKIHTCQRCDHVWASRASNPDPTICPKCKTPYWRVPPRHRRAK